MISGTKFAICPFYKQNKVVLEPNFKPAAGYCTKTLLHIQFMRSN